MRTCEHGSCWQPVFGTDKNTRIGYCKNHQGLRTDLDRRTIAQKAMAKAKSSRKGQSAEKQAEIGQSSDLWQWFLDRRSEMNGFCAHCQNVTWKDSDAYFKFCIAHILPKSKNSGCPSVATHPKNWIELCADCHTVMDNKLLLLSEMNCFDTIVNRFQAIYPHVRSSEKKRIPVILLNYINTDS